MHNKKVLYKEWKKQEGNTRFTNNYNLMTVERGKDIYMCRQLQF